MPGPSPCADPVEPLYKSLAIALVPQPRELPPPPFDTEDLQRVFSEVVHRYPYQSFEFMFGGRGAQFTNGPDDMVEIRPQLFQIQAKMDGPEPLPTQSAVKKVQTILGIAADRLKVQGFLNCTVAVIASVPAPKGSAVAFVTNRLLRDGEKMAKELGPDYVPGGVRFRCPLAGEVGEAFLSIEPLIRDDTLVYLEHQVGRGAATGPITLDQVSTWSKEAFEFVEVPTMRLLSG